MDYSAYGDGGDGAWDGQRFAVVYHLLSISYNCRLRLRVFAADDDFPVVDSVIGIWPLPIGMSAKPSIFTASCSPGIPICAGF